MNRKEAMHTLKDIFDYFWIEIEDRGIDGELTEIMEVLEKPITLSDLLGWEEDVEYDYKDLYVLKVENNRLFMKSEKCSSGWCNFALFTDEIEELQQATKVEKKQKAYHVKDEYSYKCLMKELEEQGYDMNFKNNPFAFEGEIYIFEEEEKELDFLVIKLNKVLEKYDLIEYYKEEPKFYAKIKGTEIYMNHIDYTWGGFTTIEGRAINMTKTEWAELGINDSNADWEEVAE